MSNGTETKTARRLINEVIFNVWAPKSGGRISVSVRNASPDDAAMIKNLASALEIWLNRNGS